MSNCIRFGGKGSVTLLDSQIDVAALEALLARVADLPEAPKGDTPGYVAWWFLSRDVVKVLNGGIRIRFGRGRSIHTFRDFRATLHVLADLMPQPVPVIVSISDMENRTPYERARILVGGGQVSDFEAV